MSGVGRKSLQEKGRKKLPVALHSQGLCACTAYSALGWWIGGGRKRKPIPNAHLEEIAEPFFSKMYPQSWHQMFSQNFEIKHFILK